ncbi:MAG: hypothetical protein IK045_04175 [Bacteroidales bacterium]|nr:hypothetical protein [Bacteroidales bacterium]
MRLWKAYILAAVLALPTALSAQEATGEEPALDERTRLEIQTRLDQYLEGMTKIHDAVVARLPVSPDAQFTDGYINVLNHRLKGMESNLLSLGVRWDNYCPLQQWAITQDEGLMASVESFELMRQEATDSMAVRKQQILSLQAFIDAQALFERLDTAYNSLGKKAFSLSLTEKTAPLLEKEKKKEALLFAQVDEKFALAQQAGQDHLVSPERMEALEESYAALKNKSDAIQQMTYKPLIQRVKDYLIGLAAVAVLLMFLSMAQAKIKAAKAARENLKKMKETMKLNGMDDYPTI